MNTLKEKISSMPYKKKVAIALVLVLCLVGGSVTGYKVMTSSDFGKAEVSSTELKDAEKAEDKAVSEEKKAEEELEKAKKSGDKEAIEKAEKKVEAAKEKVSSAKKEVASANKGSSHKGNSSTNKPSKPSSGNSGSSGSSSGGSSSSKPSKPTHQHSWQPVYGEKQVAYETIEYYYPPVCNDCEREISEIRKTEDLREHLYNHVINGGTGGTSEGIIRKEKKVTKYKTEKYIKYYKCSCGATK